MVAGEYFVDLLVEDVLLVELKTVEAQDDAHRMQCTNSLKATGLQLCLVLNFGKPRLEIKRLARDRVARVSLSLAPPPTSSGQACVARMI